MQYFPTSIFTISDRNQQFLQCFCFQAGKQFSRKAGTGIALIEIKLLDSNNTPSECLNVGVTSDQDLPLAEMDSLRFRKLQKNETTASQIHLSVRVVNTTLKTDILHKWIGKSCMILLFKG
jgi:hypothetical protein